MSELIVSESAAPSTPANGTGTHYEGTDQTPRFIADSGVDVTLSQNSKPNWIRNSGFWFAQRQDPPTATQYFPASNQGRIICADGWGISAPLAGNGAMTYARVDTIAAPETGLKARYYGKLLRNQAIANKLTMVQVIEAMDVDAIRGGTVRVQISAKAMVNAATWRLGLAVITANASADIVPGTAGSLWSVAGAAGVDPTFVPASNVSYLTPRSGITGDGGTIVGNCLNMSLSTTVWQQFGLVFDVPFGAKNLLLLVFSDDVVANTAGIGISQASITDGMAIQTWAPLAVDEELIRVQRFFCKSFGVDVNPAQNAGLAGAIRGQVSVAGITASQPIGVRFPTALRSPSGATFTFYNPSAANAFTRNTTAGTDATATSLSAINDFGADIFFTGIAAWTVAQSVAVHYRADNEI